MADAEEIKTAFSNSERIGVIGSPSSSSGLKLDILATAIEKQLVGNLSIFNYRQEGDEQYALGQITDITMRNPMTEDSTVKSIIRNKPEGRVDPLTERQDTHVANMMLSSVFSVNTDHVEQSMLGTVPATGTLIKLLDNDVLNALLADYQRELFYLGKVYGADVRMPMWFKHFGAGDGGINEAYHMGIFGKTGSGKTVLAQMVITAYARHPDMSIFILDPQGELTNSFRENTELGQILRNRFQKAVTIVAIQDMVLNFNQQLFTDLLVEAGFFKILAVWFEEHPGRIVHEIHTRLTRQGTLEPRIAPWNWHQDDAFDRIWDNFDAIIAAQVGQQAAADRITGAWRSADRDHMHEIWNSVCNLFRYNWQGQQRTRIDQMFGQRNAGEFMVLDLSARDATGLFWNDNVKILAINQILRRIEAQASEQFNQTNEQGEHESINTLVVLDEAHRLAPKDKSESGNASLDETLNGLKNFLVDAVRTTRKYGLGWMFISQTLSSLDRRIIDQLRIFMVGFGLAWGLERLALRDLIGGNEQALSLYQQFKDPQSTLGESKEYSFMTVGPVSPLSFSGTPLFFKSLDYPSDFVEENGIEVQDQNQGQPNQNAQDEGQ